MLLALPVLTRSLITDHDSWADLEMLALLCYDCDSVLDKASLFGFCEHRSYGIDTGVV